jgi:hypothetical protein
MCVPIDDDINSAKQGWLSADRPRRLRLVCDGYGLDADGRVEIGGMERFDRRRRWWADARPNFETALQ